MLSFCWTFNLGSQSWYLMLDALLCPMKTRKSKLLKRHTKAIIKKTGLKLQLPDHNPPLGLRPIRSTELCSCGPARGRKCGGFDAWCRCPVLSDETQKIKLLERRNRAVVMESCWSQSFVIVISRWYADSCAAWDRIGEFQPRNDCGKPSKRCRCRST